MVPSLRQSALLVFCGFLGAMAYGQESPAKKEAEPAKKKITFSDDFQRDSRSQYDSVGPIKWERGELTLGDRASFGKRIDGGAKAELTLHLETPAIDRDGQMSEVWIRFGVQGAGMTSVVVRHQWTDGKITSEILVVDSYLVKESGESKPKSQDFLQRRLTGLELPRVLRLTVAYRHGLVIVARDNKELAAGHVAKNGIQPVESWLVSNQTGTLACRRVSFSSTARPPALTREQQLLLRESEKLHTSFVRLSRAGKFQQAQSVAQRVADIRKHVFGKSHLAYAASLTEMAVLYKSMGNYAKAMPLFVQARATYEDVLGKAHPYYATSLNNLAVLFESMGQYAKAEPLHLEAMEIKRKVLGESHPDFASSLNNLAELYTSTARYSKAAPLYIKARDIYKTSLGETHPHYATSLSNVALLYQKMANYGDAEPLYTKALDITKKAFGEGHPDYALSLNNLASLYQDVGKYGKAERLYIQARDIFKKVQGEDHPSFAAVLNNLAELYRSMADYARAEPLYVKSLEIKQKVLGKEHADCGLALNNLAILYKDMGDFAKAEVLCVQALDITKKALGEAHPLYANSLNNLAALYDDMGEYAKAEARYQRAAEINKAALGKQHANYAIGLSNLATVYKSTREYAKAEPLYIQALDITKKALGEAHPLYANSLNNLAALYDDMGNYAKAEPLYLQARDIKTKVLGKANPDCAQILNNLALLYDRSENYTMAERQLRRGLDIKRQHLELTFAVQSQRQQLIRFAGMRLTLGHYLSLASRAKVAAADAYRHALSWKGAVFARQGVARQLRDDATNSKLFAQLQQVSAQLAKQSFAVSTLKTRQRWLEKIETLTDEKHKLEVELSRRSAEFRSGQALSSLTPAELQRALPEGTALVDFLEYTRFQPSPKSKGGFDLQRHLLAFVVPSRGEIRRIEFGPHEPIAEAIQRWRKAVEAKQFADRKTALELRRLLWTPLEKHLQGAKTVLVSPDGALNRFPFAALPGAKPVTYLLEERAIAVVPVPQLLPQLLATKPATEGRAPGQSLLLVGDVDYGQSPGKAGGLMASRSAPGGNPKGPLWDFQMLDHTGTEIATIGESFKRRFANGTVRQLRRGSATESTFRAAAPKHRWLHLATHGYFAPARIKSALAPQKDEGPTHGLFARKGVTGFHPGLLSGLALTGANTPPKEGDDDGILTALEVAAIDLRGTELAVLSACHTGLGQVAAGEGVLGLQRAFQVSGARTTVTSLWQVDDLATKEMMVRFYGNLWNKKQPKLAALRETQLWMIRNGKEFLQDEYRRQGRGARDLVRVTDDQPKTDRLPPYYWASFILSGDWR